MEIKIPNVLRQYGALLWGFDSAIINSTPEDVAEHVRDHPISRLDKPLESTDAEHSSATFLASCLEQVKDGFERKSSSSTWQIEHHLISCQYKPYIDWYIETFDFRSSLFSQYHERHFREQIDILLRQHDRYPEFLRRLRALAKSDLEPDSRRYKNSIGWLLEHDRQSLIAICKSLVNDSDRPPIRCVTELAKLEPSRMVLDLIRAGISDSPELRWQSALDPLLMPAVDAELQKEAIELAQESFENSPDLSWLKMLAKCENKGIQPWILERLKTLPFDSLVCRVAYGLDTERAIEFYEWALESGQRFAPRHVAHGIQAMIFNVQPEKLPLVHWVIERPIGSECIEFACEAWWTTHGIDSARQHLVPKLKAGLTPDTPTECLLMIINGLGQILRDSHDETTLRLIEKLIPHIAGSELKPYQKINILRSTHLIGGELAKQLCIKLAAAYTEDRIVNDLAFQFEFQWLKNNLTQADLLKFLDQHDFPGDVAVEDVYQSRWDEHDNRRLSAPSLGIWPLGDAELALHMLVAKNAGFAFEYNECDTKFALGHFEFLSRGSIEIKSLHVADMKTDDDPYSEIQMVVNDQLIKVPCSGNPRICDPLEIADLLNAFLDDTNIPERFFSIGPMDEAEACILFGTEDWKSSLSKRFFFPVSPEAYAPVNDR